MKNERIERICTEYVSALRRHCGATPLNREKGGSRIQHIAWMAEEIPRFLLESRKDKAFRWLGFIQGALWYKGLYTIEELKQHNKLEPQ